MMEIRNILRTQLCAGIALEVGNNYKQDAVKGINWLRRSDWYKHQMDIQCKETDGSPCGSVLQNYTGPKPQCPIHKLTKYTPVCKTGHAMFEHKIKVAMPYGCDGCGKCSGHSSMIGCSICEIDYCPSCIKNGKHFKTVVDVIRDYKVNSGTWQQKCKDAQEKQELALQTQKKLSQPDDFWSNWYKNQDQEQEQRRAEQQQRANNTWPLSTERFQFDYNTWQQDLQLKHRISKVQYGNEAVCEAIRKIDKVLPLEQRWKEVVKDGKIVGHVRSIFFLSDLENKSDGLIREGLQKQMKEHIKQENTMPLFLLKRPLFFIKEEFRKIAKRELYNASRLASEAELDKLVETMLFQYIDNTVI